jgi:DNA replication initiation complex subunit (GINS family)
MIKITYKHLSQYPLMEALQVLVGTSMDSQTAFEVGKISEKLTQAERELKKNYVEFVKTQVAGWEPGQKLELEGETKDNFTKAEAKFFEGVELCVDRKPVSFTKLGRAQLTPAQVLALQPVLTDLPGEETQKGC